MQVQLFLILPDYEGKNLGIVNLTSMLDWRVKVLKRLSKRGYTLISEQERFDYYYPWKVRDADGNEADVHVCFPDDSGTMLDAFETDPMFQNSQAMLRILKNIVSSAPITGLPLALEKHIQDAAGLITKLKREMA